MVKFPNTQIQRFDRNASNYLLSSTIFEGPYQAGPSEVAPQPSTLQPPPPAPVQNHPQLPQSDSEFDFVYTENTARWFLIRKQTLDIGNTKNYFLTLSEATARSKNLRRCNPKRAPFFRNKKHFCLLQPDLVWKFWSHWSRNTDPKARCTLKSLPNIVSKRSHQE